MNYLLLYSGNWNDEITVDGFVIVDKLTKNKIQKILLNNDDSITINVGDENIDYDDGKELLDEITFEKLTDAESDAIEKYFGKYNDFGYNLFLNIDKIHDEINIIE